MNSLVKQEEKPLLVQEPMAVNGNNQYLMMMHTAIEKGSQLETIEKLMDLHERYEDRMAKKAFDEALSQFQGMLPVIAKRGEVNYAGKGGMRTNYQYAQFDDIAAAIREPLNKTGLSYRHSQRQSNGMVTVICKVSHKMGHSEETELTSTMDTSGGKDPMKALASTLTYLRRYTLISAVGIVVGGEDDDGMAATRAAEATKQQQKQVPETKTYPDDQFSKVFSAWSEQIRTGKKTAGQIDQFVRSKGFTLTQQQIEKLNAVS